MSSRKQRIEELEYAIRTTFRKEQQAQTKVDYYRYLIWRWALMLYWKLLKDDITVRAESLAFLMTFSLLPLLAGVFFILSIFSKFGFVDEVINSAIARVLSTLPPEHREMFQEYIFKFRDTYLETLFEKSGSLGVFALLFLVWVGLKSFNNMERTLNFIWFAERTRPFMERVRNFIVVALGAPFVIVASLSVPIILSKVPFTREFLKTVPIFNTFINFIVPFALSVGIFCALYRFLPVRKVQWKSALTGAAFAAVLLYIANFILNIYFQFGTHTVYGKAAIIPLIGLWIYSVWVIVILGAEVSYLIQNQQYLSKAGRRVPSIFEGESMLAILVEMLGAYRQGSGPLSFQTLFNHTSLEADALRKILKYLENRTLILQCVSDKESFDTVYTLARDISDITIKDILNDFMIEGRPTLEHSPIEKAFAESLQSWLRSFGTATIKDFVKGPSAPLKT